MSNPSAGKCEHEIKIDAEFASDGDASQILAEFSTVKTALLPL
jgi:hypothetical protein